MSNLNFKSGNPRRLVFYGIIGAVFFILTGAFYQLQILQQSLYSQKSRRNSVKIETQIPARGLVYDRNGQLIVDNRSSYSLYLVPAETKSQTIAFLAEVLGIEAEQLRKRIRYSSRRFHPIKIARYIDLVTLTLLQENKSFLSGLEWKVEPKRNYVYDKSFTHVLGTLGEISERELARDAEYESGDLIGKRGLEKVLDKELRGKKGYRFLKVDATGKIVEELAASKNSRPSSGKDLYLSIDVRLQLLADSLLGERNGAVVAIDVRNGEVLTMLSKPYYDLSAFAEAVKPEVWHQLMVDPARPLFNRSCQATYPPGSTYKMVTAIAALNEGIVDTKWSVYCPGYLSLGRTRMRCWNEKGHGDLSLVGAIRSSCNVYFYKLGMRVGIDLWHRYSKLLRFGEKTEIELSEEKSGFVPGRAFYDRVFGRRRWTKGLMANVAIGQGELLVTPLQMAQFAMILANSGTYYQPHLSKKLFDKAAEKEHRFVKAPQYVKGIKPLVWQVVREGMRQVVAGGTGWRAGVWKVTGAGKTGTAQNPHGKTHAWYVGFAPFENPEIAIAVLVENGGSGGGTLLRLPGNY